MNEQSNHCLTGFLIMLFCIAVTGYVHGQKDGSTHSVGNGSEYQQEAREWTALSGKLSRMQASVSAPPAGVVTTKFSTGMLLGNGDIGIVAGDRTDQQTFYFGKSDFWGAAVKYPDKPDVIWQGSILSLGGLSIRAADTAIDPEAGTTDPGTGADDPGTGPVYNMQQDIVHAEVRTRMRLGTAIVTMHSWTADAKDGSANNFFITELTANKDILLHVSLWVPATYKAGAKLLDCSGIYPYAAGYTGNTLWTTRENFDTTANFDNGDHIGNYRVVEGTALALSGASFIHLNKDNGSVAGDIPLQAGKRIYLIACFETDKWTGQEKRTRPEAMKDKAMEEVQVLDPSGIAALKTAHEDWWKQYWLRSWVSLSDTTLEKFYYGSLYLLGCSMRAGDFPPSLFGNWITTDLTAWGGRYFLNYNEQAALYGVYSSNRPDLALPYISAILHEMPWQRNKTHDAGFDGVCHQRSLTPDHIVAPVPETRPIAPTKNIKKLPTDQKSNGMFTAMPLIWYSEYTGDVQYLQDTLYPYLKELDRFYRSYVSTDKKPYHIEHSSAHEGSDDLDPNLDLGFMRKLSTTLINAASVLNLDKDLVPVWQDMLDNLADYPTIIRNGQVVYTEAAEVNGSTDPARLFHPGDQPVNLEGGVFPGENIYWGGDTTRLRIARQSLEQLGGWCVNKGGSEHNGFPKHWPVAARIGWPADDLLEKFSAAIRFHWRESNYTAFQGGGGIETAGAIEGINSMLLQSEGHCLKLFPVWPPAKDASFTRLRAKGAFLVSAAWRQGRVTQAEIVSMNGNPVSLQKPWSSGSIRVFEWTGHSRRLITYKEDGLNISFETQPGKRYSIDNTL